MYVCIIWVPFQRLKSLKKFKQHSSTYYSSNCTHFFLISDLCDVWVFLLYVAHRLQHFYLWYGHFVPIHLWLVKYVAKNKRFNRYVIISDDFDRVLIFLTGNFMAVCMTCWAIMENPLSCEDLSEDTLRAVDPKIDIKKIWKHKLKILMIKVDTIIFFRINMTSTIRG